MNTINKYGIACMYTITLCTLRGHSCNSKYVRNKNAVDNQFYLQRGHSGKPVCCIESGNAIML